MKNQKQEFLTDILVGILGFGDWGQKGEDWAFVDSYGETQYKDCFTSVSCGPILMDYQTRRGGRIKQFSFISFPFNKTFPFSFSWSFTFTVKSLSAVVGKGLQEQKVWRVKNYKLMAKGQGYLNVHFQYSATSCLHQDRDREKLRVIVRSENIKSGK